MKKFNQFCKTIMEEMQCPFKNVSTQGLRQAPIRRKVMDYLKTLLMSQNDKREILRRLYRNVVNLKQKNLTDQQINDLFIKTVNFIDEYFYKKFSSSYAIFGKFIQIVCRNQQPIVNYIDYLSRQEVFFKKLYDLISQLGIESDKNKVVIVKKNGKVALFKSPYDEANEKTQMITSEWRVVDEGFINWIKNTLIPKNKYVLEKQIEI